MKYADLIDGEATPSELRSFLVDGENVAVTVRIPKNMRDAAREAAALNGVSFTSLVKTSLIEYLSKKEKLGTRVKNIMNIFVPLIFTTLDRIELISNAMDLRGFGKHKKRTWYAGKPLGRNDYLVMLFAAAVLAGSICVSVFVNGSRFYNPFV